MKGPKSPKPRPTAPPPSRGQTAQKIQTSLSQDTSLGRDASDSILSRGVAQEETERKSKLKSILGS